MLFFVPQTDFCIQSDRSGYQVFFRCADPKAEGGFALRFLWQFSSLENLCVQLPTLIGLFLKSSRDASREMKAQKKLLQGWLAQNAREALPAIRQARRALEESIREKEPRFIKQADMILGTNLIIQPLENKGYEIYQTGEPGSKPEFIWHAASLEHLLVRLPQLLTEQPFNWKSVGAKNLFEQYITCVNWVRFQIDPAAMTRPKRHAA